MKLFDTDPSLRWAFCMTHPDDEISICAWIKWLVDNGNEVYVSWTHNTPVREREGRAVATMLGVPQDHLRFFGATDGSVCDEIGGLVPQFQAWFAEVRPDRVCCGAFEQGHLDHDSTNYLVNKCFEGPVLEIPFYHTYLTRLQILNRFSDPSSQEVRQLTEPEQRLKRLVAHQYPSQNIWRLLVMYETAQLLSLKGMQLARTEQMRLQGPTDFLSPNHPPQLADRVSKSRSWHRWVAAIKRL